MTDPRVTRGLSLLLARDWYEAHESLEAPWREASGDRRLFLQTLIQASVALEHLRRGNPRGAWGQWNKARDKAARLPRLVEGVHLAGWMADLEAFFADIELGERSRRHVARLPPSEPSLSELPPPETWPLPAIDGADR